MANYKTAKQKQTEAETGLEIELRAKTPSTWTEYVLSHFDEFLIDHAACEKKASATAVQFVVKYPDRPELANPMLCLAREELLHFHQVTRLIVSRGLQLHADEKDPYVNGLLKISRNGRDTHFIDRLLIFGIIEARGTERFGMIAEALQPGSLKKFYTQLTEAESRHHQIFIDMALKYFDKNEIAERLDFLLDEEAKIVKSTRLRAAVH